MLDYYELLGISRNISERELKRKIDAVLSELSRQRTINPVGTSFNLIAHELYYGFDKTLENYGSKENYDRALNRSKKVFKVVVLNKDTIKKIALTFVIAGTITGTAIGVGVYRNNNYTDVYISPYGMSITELCNHYGIKSTELKFDSLMKKLNHGDTIDGVDVTVKNDKAEEIKEKMEERKEIYENPKVTNQEYSFQYRVTNLGMTPEKLVKDHGVLRKSFSYEKDGKKIIYSPDYVLPYGKVLTLYTNNPNVAERMQRIFDEEEYIEPISFEEYYAKSGERLPDIANTYGVSVNDIMGYNSDIYSQHDFDINFVPLGEALKIPQYEKIKTR